MGTISAKEFEAGDFCHMKHIDKDKIVNHRVARLLRKHSATAFDVKEIFKRTRISKETIRRVLNELVKRKVAEHSKPYFKWKVSKKR